MASSIHDGLIHDWNLEEPPAAAPLRVTLDDETLRDGLQNPSVRNPDIGEKAELVRLMDQLGIHTANVGLPGAGDRHYTDALELARLMVNEKLSITPNVACRTMISDIEPVRRMMDAAGIAVTANCFIGSSPIRLYTEGWTIDTILGHVEKSLTYARDNEIPFTLVTEDTTRANPDDVARLYQLAIDLGADRLVVCDTCGHATPEGAFRLIRFVKDLADAAGRSVCVDWHGHRDRGLAMSNCLAAIRAGADQIHGAALGVGERAGNAAMDLILVNLLLLGWIDNDLTALSEYCNLAARILGVEIPPNYPVVGHDAFLTGTGVHAAAVIKAINKGDEWLADRVYSGVPASDFGIEQTIGVGPMSGRSNVVYWLGKNGHSQPSDALVDHVFQAAKGSNRLLTDDELTRVLGAFDSEA